MSDLSSLALPDTPELPEEIERFIDSYGSECYEVGFQDAEDDPIMAEGARKARENADAALRSVIAKHLQRNRAPESLLALRDAIVEVIPEYRVTSSIQSAVYGLIHEYSALRLLSGSSRGEE